MRQRLHKGRVLGGAATVCGHGDCELEERSLGLSGMRNCAKCVPTICAILEILYKASKYDYDNRLDWLRARLAAAVMPGIDHTRSGVVAAYVVTEQSNRSTDVASLRRHTSFLEIAKNDVTYALDALLFLLCPREPAATIYKPDSLVDLETTEERVALEARLHRTLAQQRQSEGTPRRTKPDDQLVRISLVSGMNSSSCRPPDAVERS